MSSAALQPAPHPATTVSPIGSHSSLPASPSSRPYASPSSQSRDPYYNQQPPASSTASRRTSRRPSANGVVTESPQQQQHSQPQYYSPTGSAPGSATITQRTATSVDPPSPPLATTTTTTASQRSGPPVAPPRTSSNQRNSHATTDRSSRRTGQYSDDRRSSRMANSGEEYLERERGGSRQPNGVQPSDVRDALAAAAASASSRRRPQEQTRSTPTSPNGPSREASEVLNQVVISKPEVDIQRERERMEATQASRSAEAVDEASRGTRSRHDHSTSKREKHTRFGDYYLGNTLGEGEFGKVKMGWKQEGGVQVAIKLIRRDSVGNNPSRLNKIYREIAILREISHPNIVRLHEMVETDRYIGIILEYASGGELFDYILNHRYLKDNAARRLFAQLVSGVGYLHKKGIVHRDLKLENLLLDRNRNIIITDFGFANTFSPNDELGEELEFNLHSKDFVKRMELDKILPNGHRRGDLMQTSCGSPCYAAPELVVSDSLYTGRKVDVWSCGVILYAMLAGYLPFDDDPANPEGDNINLLYKYIVSTPLTFPEYVTPHARDLLRRILVPDPRKRADLFEVARHSWLSEYASVVGLITSTTTSTMDIANTTVTADEMTEEPKLARSASVREPSKTQKSQASAVGDLARKHGKVDQEVEDVRSKTSKDTKRRTVQVEYVDPKTHTARGDNAAGGSRTRARSGSQGPVEVPVAQITNRVVSAEKPLPKDPPSSYRDPQFSSSQGRPSSQRSQGMPPPTRPGREQPRAVSDAPYATATTGPSIARPPTGGSMASTGSMILPTQKSYGQPVAPTVAGTNAQGRMSQPGQLYAQGRPGTTGQDPKLAQITASESNAEGRGHKRSNTIGGIGEKIFGRSNSIFGRSREGQERSKEKPKKSYPPVSMTTATMNAEPTPRQSTDSRRSFSLGFGRKRSGSIAGSQSGSQQEKATRRFSLLPASFSLKAIGIGKDYGQDDRYYDQGYDGSGTMDSLPIEQQPGQYQAVDRGQGSPYDAPQSGGGPITSTPRQQPMPSPQTSGPNNYTSPQYHGNSQPVNDSQSSIDYQNQQRPRPSYAPAYTDSDPDFRRTGPNNRPARGVLQKNNRKFADAWDQDPDSGYGSHHAGSSGAARKVMDFFRRRGKARTGD